MHASASCTFRSALRGDASPAGATAARRCACRSALVVSNTAGPYRRPPTPGGGAPRPAGGYAPRPGGSFAPRPPGTGPPSTGPRPPPRDRFQRRDTGPPPPPMNENIRVPSVRLVGEEKEPLGIMTRAEALAAATAAELDLVMISPDADPPVCRIMNYSKYRYEQEQKAKDAKKKMAASRVEQKELKMRYNIGQADYEVRLRAAQRFLKDGDKVKLLCQFRGREMEFKQLAFDMFAKFATDLKDDGAIETRPSIEGRAMMMILAPLKSDTLAKAAAEKAAQQPKAALAKKPVLDTPAAAPEAAAAPAPVAAAEPVAAAASE